MQLFGVLTISLLVLCTADALVCYVCVSARSCLGALTCPDFMDRCATITVNGLFIKGCLNSTLCTAAIENFCCDSDLCNAGGPTGPSVVLTLVSLAIITLFLKM